MATSTDSTTLSEQVYCHVLDRLLQGALRPGEFLDRKQIASDLNVSLIPVSDAVQKLTYDGFLTTRRRHGTIVRNPDIEDIRGQIILREALECQAARLYCGDVIRKAKSRLKSLATAADKAAASGKKICSEDFNFHLALIELTDCAALLDCFKRVVNMSMFHHLSVITPVLKSVYDKHLPLLEDLCEASPAQAEARIRLHMRARKELMLGK